MRHDRGRRSAAGPSEVLVCSTGLIGIPFPIDTVIGRHPGRWSPAADAPTAAAGRPRAIMTTDTVAKEVVVAGAGFTVGGMAKGAAMLAPNMATDARRAHHRRRRPTPDACCSGVLREPPSTRSFNVMMTVDGCTSTNDTVIVLASGRGRCRSTRGDLADAAAEACVGLAAPDGGRRRGRHQGGAGRGRRRGQRDAEAAAGRPQGRPEPAVQVLVVRRGPVLGPDRAASSASAGIAFDLDRVSVAYGGIDGLPPAASRVDHDADGGGRGHLAERHLEVAADLGLGAGEATVLTNDLTHGYIDENMRTS